MYSTNVETIEAIDPPIDLSGSAELIVLAMIAAIVVWVLGVLIDVRHSRQRDQWDAMTGYERD